MKKFPAGFVLALPALLLSTVFLFSAKSTDAITHVGQHDKKHGLSVKQYEAFHDVLHPLEHEALPNKDFRRIRAKSALLMKRGLAIVKLGVPGGTGEDQKEEFTKCLNTFSKALAEHFTRSAEEVMATRSQKMRRVP